MNEARPQCWGREYDSEDRECKGCGWQVSCRQHVIREAVNRQPVGTVQAPTPTAMYYQPFQAPSPPPQPAPVRVVTPPATYQSALSRPIMVQQPQQPSVQVVPYRTPTSTPPSPVAQQPQAQPAHVMEWYGRFQDPMAYYVVTTPPQYRPQLPGESFGQRFFKNILLAALEAAMGGLFLGVRQLVWAPPAPTQDV